MKNKITATEFIEERAKCDFNMQDLAVGILGEETKNYFDEIMKDIADHKDGIASPPDYYEMTSAEKQTLWFKKLNYIIVIGTNFSSIKSLTEKFSSVTKNVLHPLSLFGKGFLLLKFIRQQFESIPIAPKWQF